MPTIIVQANQSHGDTNRVTLRERVIATHLADQHAAAQLIARLAWAVLDAERLEADQNGEHAATPDLAPRSSGSRVDRALSRPRTPALAGERRGSP